MVSLSPARQLSSMIWPQFKVGTLDRMITNVINTIHLLYCSTIFTFYCSPKRPDYSHGTNRLENRVYFTMRRPSKRRWRVRACLRQTCIPIPFVDMSVINIKRYDIETCYCIDIYRYIYIYIYRVTGAFLNKL